MINTDHIDFNKIASELNCSIEHVEEMVERAAHDQEYLCVSCADDIHDKPVGAVTQELNNKKGYAIFILCVDCSRRFLAGHWQEIQNNIAQHVAAYQEARRAHGHFGSGKKLT